MSAVLDEVLAETLSNAIAVAGRWIVTAVNSPHYRRRKQDADIAEWFDTYKLSASSATSIELPSDINVEEVRLAVESNEVQAILLELLCARITSAPETDIASICEALASAIASRVTSRNTQQITEALFNYYDTEVCDLVGRLAGAQEDVFARLRNEAFSVRIIAVLNAISQHVQSIADRTACTDEMSYLTNYCRHVRDYHGKIQPPDSDRRQRIPIDDLYVPPRLVRANDFEFTRQASRSPATGIEYSKISSYNYMSVSDLRAQLDRTVLLGDPGGGKSTTSNVLMYALANDVNSRIPFMVTLRDFALEGANISIATYIERKLDSLYQCPPPHGLIRQLLLTGRALVIFDGLDELTDTARRLEITDVVEQFCAEYPLTTVLVTSRVVGYSEAELDTRQFVCYRLVGFSEDQTADYVGKWFSQDTSIDPSDVTRWTRNFMEDSQNVPDLRSNPLMLSLMCILYHGEGSIPRNRPEVYEKCADLLFRKWDARRRISADLRAQNLIEPAIRHLAYFMYTRDVVQSEVTEQELVKETALFLRSRGFESEEDAVAASRQFVEFCRGRAWVFTDAGTTASGVRLYTFTHRTFLEYFAAAYLALGSDTPEELAKRLLPHVAKQEWDVVAELAVQKKSQITDRGAERAIDAMLHERRQRSSRGRGNVLRFLGRCVAYAEVPPRQIRELTHKTLDHLASGNPTHELYYSPVAALAALEMPEERRDIVRDEILLWASELIASAEESDNILGLGVIVFIDTCVYEFHASVYDARNLGYWRAVATESRITYRDKIVSMSDSNSSMLRLALQEEFLDVGTVMKQLAGDATILLEEIPVGVFKTKWIGFLQWTLEDTVQSGSPEKPLRAFSRLGKYFAQNMDKLPWVDRSKLSGPSRVTFAASESGPVAFDPTTFLGVAATACTLLELDTFEPDAVSVLWGYLPALEPYWRQRSMGEVGELPALSVASQCEALFRAWAEGSIDFVTPRV